MPGGSAELGGETLAEFRGQPVVLRVSRIVLEADHCDNRLARHRARFSPLICPDRSDSSQDESNGQEESGREAPETVVDTRTTGPAAGTTGDAEATFGDEGRARSRNSLLISRAVCTRWRGSFSRQRRTMRARPSGSSGRRSVTDGGVSRRIAEINSAEELPSNGRFPVAISCRTTPREKMSVRWSSGRPDVCSGDM